MPTLRRDQVAPPVPPVGSMLSATTLPLSRRLTSTSNRPIVEDPPTLRRFGRFAEKLRKALVKGPSSHPAHQLRAETLLNSSLVLLIGAITYGVSSLAMGSHGAFVLAAAALAGLSGLVLLGLRKVRHHAAAQTLVWGFLTILCGLVVTTGMSATIAAVGYALLVIASRVFSLRGSLAFGITLLILRIAAEVAVNLGWVQNSPANATSDYIISLIEIAAMTIMLGWSSQTLTRLFGELRRREQALILANHDQEENRLLLAELVDGSPDGILRTDSNGIIELCNPALITITGFTADQLEGKSIEAAGFLTDPSIRLANAALKDLLAGLPYPPFELEIRRRDGSLCPVEVNGHLLRRPGGPPSMQATIRDISERKENERVRHDLEIGLRQAQRVEAIGRLAGGIAHDFNNLLTVILTNASLMKTRTLDEETTEDIVAIEKAALRAAELTRQLLAFSRKQIRKLRILRLEDPVAEAKKMLARILPENIDLVFRPETTSIRIKADPSQIEQVVMNLAVNARDAMPTGGTLTISTAEHIITVATASATGEIPPGRYATLSIGDTGVGMDTETVERIFDPFFTTKPVGQGTGLGLATVHGVVTQSGGFIRVLTEPGQGTTFEALFPASEEDPASLATEGPLPSDTLRGTETILLVEDDPAVRRTAERILRTLGYTVIAAGDANDALSALMSRPDGVDLLLTDVVMPGASGVDLAARIQSQSPMRVLYMSGYADEAIRSTGVLERSAFLPKPFTPSQLGRRVRETLDSPVPAG